MITTIQKWGNSQGIRIPKFILDEIQWNNDEKISITTDNDRIVIEKADQPKTIKELFADYHGEYVPETIDWGNPAGEEIW